MRKLDNVYGVLTHDKISKVDLLEGLRSKSEQFLSKNYCCVVIKNIEYEGLEFIINDRRNFEDKANYYDNAYTDDLVLKTCNKISISGYAFADEMEQLVTYMNHFNRIVNTTGNSDTQ